MIRIPPSPIAPMASSGWNGTPSLRTTITSSGASSSLATSNATGTPPRGRPRTTTSLPRRNASSLARLRPASARSANSTGHLTHRLNQPLPVAGLANQQARGALRRWRRSPVAGHHDDRAVRVMHDLVAGRADQQPGESARAAGSYHQQVGIMG